MNRAAAVALVVLLSACAGDAPEPVDGPADPAAAQAVETPVVEPASAAARAQPDTVGLADPCLRGGTPRANVTRIMGEPDSVVYGSWFYGASEVLFGYGVVVEIRDRGELVLCD